MLWRAPKKAATTSSPLNKTLINNQKKKKRKERIKDGLSGDNITGLRRCGNIVKAYERKECTNPHNMLLPLKEYETSEDHIYTRVGHIVFFSSLFVAHFYSGR